jgi:hypothetical protein
LNALDIMPNYSAIAKTALASIKKAGFEVAITRPVRTVDPITGVPTPGVAQTGKITLVTLPARKGTVEGFDRVFERESFVKESILYIIAAAEGATLVPDLLDTLSIDGGTWEIRGIGTLKPAGVALIYKLGAVKR